MGRKVQSREVSEERLPPGISPEEQEDECIALAVSLAAKQLRDGTAKAQVIQHYLKRSSLREQLEMEKLVHENELLKAKTEEIRSSARIEELYNQAMKAMRAYSGSDEDEVY